MKRAIVAAVVLMVAAGCGGPDSSAQTAGGDSTALTTGAACSLYACPCGGVTHIVPTCNGTLDTSGFCPGLSPAACNYVGPQGGR